MENAALKNKTAVDDKEITILKENLENVSNTMTSVKIEVRYLSITVFGMNNDFKEIDERFQELENLTKEIETEIRVNVKSSAATLSELETRHLTLIDGLRNTTSSLQSDIDEYETNQLKISATGSSLELFRTNQTLSKCGTYVFYVTAVEYDKLYLKVNIVLNSVSKVRTMGHNSATYQTDTNMVVLNLQKGDSVWVRHDSGKGYWTNCVPGTTLTGFLIG